MTDTERLIAAAVALYEGATVSRLRALRVATKPFIKKAPRVGVVDPHLTTGYRAIELTPEVRERLGAKGGVSPRELSTTIQSCQYLGSSIPGKVDILLNLIAKGAVEVSDD